MNITVILTPAEAKALAWVAVDPQEWAENVIKERARIAMNDIFQVELARMVADPNTTSISTDIEEVVLAAEILPLAEKAASEAPEITPEIPE